MVLHHIPQRTALFIIPAAAFYTKLLGWTTVPMEGGMPYMLFKKNGTEVAGLMKLPMPGVPPHWLSYVTVENADASASRVAELGGQICKAPFDIPAIKMREVSRQRSRLA